MEYLSLELESLRYRTLRGLRRELAFAKARSIDDDPRVRRQGRRDARLIKVAIELKILDGIYLQRRAKYRAELEDKYKVRYNLLDSISRRLLAPPA